MRHFGGVVVLVLAGVLVSTGCVQAAQQQVNQIDPAQDTASQATLIQAANAARTATAETGSLADFNAAAAQAVEPSLVWTDNAAAAAGQISIRGASADGVVLVTKSGSGNVLCIALSSAGQTMGKQDAASAAQCTGGW